MPTALETLIADTKTCITKIISYTNFAILNFVARDFLKRIGRAITMKELYYITVELNAISPKLPSLIEAEPLCNNNLGEFYLPNLELILTTNLTPGSDKIGDLSTLNLQQKETVVAALTEMLEKINTLGGGSDHELRILNLETNKADTIYVNAELDKKADKSSIPKFAVSLGLCANTATIRSITAVEEIEVDDEEVIVKENLLTSTAAAFAADLAAIFHMTPAVLTNGDVEVASMCLPRLQCVIDPYRDIRGFCAHGDTNELPVDLGNTLACKGVGIPVSQICDSSWFCNLNSLTVTYPEDNDGNMFSKLVAPEICEDFYKDIPIE